MNARPDHYTFQRYLSSKRTVDDRALNHHVWQSFHQALAQRAAHTNPLTILEIGGGIGTMVERLLEEGRLPNTSYHLLDEQADNIATANQRLQERFTISIPHATNAATFQVAPAYKLHIPTQSRDAFSLHLYTGDLFDFLARIGSLSQVDLVLAHAFLDLMDISSTLPKLTATLQPGALLYFTINFDGATILEPTLDAAFDSHIEAIYHRTMDERITDGKPSGDSHAGRHLFHQMKTAGILTLDAGSSDWVVIPHGGIYPADESYFLHFIINTMAGALRNHPDLDPVRFQTWIAKRHQQIEAGELVYIAHQLDYLGEFQANSGTSIATSRPSV